MNIAELLISVANKVKSIKDSIVNAYSAARDMGATLPISEEQNAFNLAETIRTIQLNKEVVVMNVEDEDFIIDNNDIFFIDHFGIAGAYTKEEVATWTKIEFQPKEYEFADFYEFTETLEEIQDGRVHTVGVIYKPHKCVMYINAKAGDVISIPPYHSGASTNNQSHPNFSWYPTISINWGDGEITQYKHIKGTDIKEYTHVYKKDGIFPITQDSQNGWTRTVFQVNNYMRSRIYAYFVFNGTEMIKDNGSLSYAQYALFPPTMNSYGSNFLNTAINLEVAVLPNGMHTIGINFALNASRLKYIVFSKSTDSMSGNFMKGTNLKIIDFPDSLNWVGEIGTNTRKVKFPMNYTGDITIGKGVKDIFFPQTMKINTLSINAIQKELVIPEGCLSFTMSYNSNLSNIQELYLPSTISTLNYVGYVSRLHISATTPPTIVNTSYIKVDEIYVPYSEDHSVLNEYLAATNWAALSSKIKEEQV